MIRVSVDRFPLLISNLDQMLSSFDDFDQRLSHLSLNGTFLTATECSVLAQNIQAANLRSLDLSCNHITAKGLLYLLGPQSKLSEKLQHLSLFNCEIDAAQMHLISMEELRGKVPFQLKSLNLSHNGLGSLLNFICEIDLISPQLETLHLVECQIADEQMVNMISGLEGQRCASLEFVDISGNLLGSEFTMIFRQMRESCDYLTNLICANNSGIKRAPSMQVAKSRLNLDAVLLQRLDLSNSLRGDEQVAQLAQSSYLKDLKWLNLTHCKFTQDGLDEVFQSKNLRSLEVLIVADNRIKEVIGPFNDLAEATEKQLKKTTMRLSMLDLRKNKLSSFRLTKAQAFLKETVVLLWDNQLVEDDSERPVPAQDVEFYDPSYLFRAEDDHKLVNPMHMYTEPFAR